jgi:hypothetical protein
VGAVYDRCSTDEKKLAREPAIKSQLVRELAFGGKDFDRWQGSNSVSSANVSEQAAKYRLLVEKFRDAKGANERLRLFAQWLWADLGVQPEDALGKNVTTHLSSKAAKRVNTMPWNDFYLGRLVQIWLPYCERLLEDSERVSMDSVNNQQRLRALGYDSLAVQIVTANRKKWRSAIVLTCEWLANRGGIRMVKPRKDADIARTLRNAYSRMFGRANSRLFEKIF